MSAVPSSTSPVKRVARGTNQVKKLQLERVSPAARKNAAAVLEVLAGLRSPTQAAQVLGLALPGYYNLELRALNGLMSSCEPPQKGRQKNAHRELAEAQAQCRKLAAEVQRYQALARATQRTIGLAATPPTPAKTESGRKRRKPVVRALQAIALIKGPPEAVPGAANG